MSVKITWAPSAQSDVSSYELSSGPSVTGPWTPIFTVNNVYSGANYDTVNSLFFYNDAAGTSTTWYHLVAIDQNANRSTPSTPFQPVAAPPAIPSTVRVDHNYGSPGALRYQTSSGTPIEAAIVRVYKKSDFDLGITDTPLAVTITDSSGGWVNPINLAAGYTYTVQFAKESLYGPDKIEIIV